MKLGTFFSSLVVALGSLLPAQGEPFRHQDDLNLERDRILRQREEQSVREGRLIHLLIRHGLGLRVEADEFLQLSKAEKGVSEEAARAKLHGIQADLAARAAELEKVAAQTGVALDPAKETEIVSTQIPGTPGPRRHETGAPTSKPHTPIGKAPIEPRQGPGPGRHSPGRHSPGRHSPTEVGVEDVGAPTSRRPVKDNKVARPTGKQRIQAIIRGSGNRSVVGRILFKAGKYEQALKELAPLEKDKSAPLADLFYLARCNEELHSRFKDAADAAANRAGIAKAAADKAGEEAGKLSAARRKNKVVGGSANAKDEIDKLLAKQTQSMAEFRAQDKLAKQKATQAAEYYDNAYNVLILIEGRDTVRNKDGVDVPGEWAKTARAARNMLIWFATKKEWAPPQIQWKQK